MLAVLFQFLKFNTSQRGSCEWENVVNNRACNLFYVDVFSYSEQVPIVLVGNKRDLAENERVIDVEKGEDLAAKWPHCKFLETSAREHNEVENVFVHVIREIMSFEGMKKSRMDKLHKEASKKKKSGKCLVM